MTKPPKKPRKSARIGFRVDIVLRDTGTYAPHTADFCEEWYAESIMNDLIRVAQAGRLVRVTGKMKFPAGEVIKEWKPVSHPRV